MLTRAQLLKYAPKRDSFDANLQTQSITLKEMQQALKPVAMPTMDEIRSLINTIQDTWDNQKYLNMLAACQRECLKNIATPFGLGRFISIHDKLGGNITTVHNAKKGIYADPEKEGFKGSDYRGTEYRKSRKEIIEEHADKNGNVVDGYTNKVISVDDCDVDHNISAKEMHTSGGGFTQSREKRAQRGADKRNLNLTFCGLNRSMQDKDILKWMDLPSAQDPQKTNAEFYQVNLDKVKDAMARADEANKEHSPDTLGWAQYGIGRSLMTGLREAGKMGFQQAMGIMLVNFFENLFLEVMDSYNNGFATGVNEKTFFDALKVRIKRMAQNIIGDWENILNAFTNGLASGFMSNLITSIINIFFTTARRLVRMIREGFFSLIQAFKTLFSPEHASLAEALDAALKIIIAGAMVSLGIILEEAIGKAVEALLISFPPLGTIAPMLSSALTGGVVGIATTLCVYLVEQLDFFGVHAKTRDCYIVTELEQMTRENVEDIEESLVDFEKLPLFLRTVSEP